VAGASLTRGRARRTTDARRGRLAVRVARARVRVRLAAEADVAVRGGFGMSAQGEEPRPPKILISGPPASGKGTQCEMIVKEFGVVHISTGDMLRAAVKEGTELGKEAKGYMDAGKLVPDELVISMLKERLQKEDCKQRGYLLDGFPRTKAQADELDEAGITFDAVFKLEVPDDVLIERVVGRRSDPETGKVYHMKFNPPPSEEVGQRLVQRSDDTEEKARVRLQAYYEHAASIDGKYGSMMKRLDGNQPKDTVFSEIKSAIDSAASPKKPINTIIMGAPGSGKGTQCDLITKKFGVKHLSTGDMLRAAVKAQSPLGMKAKEYMDAGKLVPDDLVIGLIKEKLVEPSVKERGWLLDGFPRTAVQADALLSAGVTPDVVLCLDVPNEEIVRRIVGRRTDPETGQIYHMEFDPPKSEEVKARLTQRSDDTEEKVRTRLEMFKQNSSLVEDKYHGKVMRINGLQPKEKVFEDVEQAMKVSIDAKEAKKSSQAPTVSEFVRKAEEAFEKGYLQESDVNWSGQAGADPGFGRGTSSPADLSRRPVLAAGDILAFLTFVAIGRANHGETLASMDTVQTAAPFIFSWLAIAPFLGAYTYVATDSWKSLWSFLLRSWAVSVPAALALRGVYSQHVPPATFAVISMSTTLVFLSIWRSVYLLVNGPTRDGDRGAGLLDGLRMVLTLVRRW